MRRSTVVRIALATLFALALPLTPALATERQRHAFFDDGPLFAAVTGSIDEPELYAYAVFGDAPPAHVTISVPRGVDLYPQRPLGATVGSVVLYGGEFSDGIGGIALLAGKLTAADTADAAANSCSPGPHVAVWRMRVNLLGRNLDAPILFSEPTATDPPGTALRIDLCMPHLPGDAQALPILALQFELPGVNGPAAPGTYVMNAVVTPYAPDGVTMLPDRAYELRALLPVPHTLSLHARYDKTTHAAVLSGRLMAVGRARAGIEIDVVSLVRKATPGGVSIREHELGSTETHADGTFLYRTRINAKTGFYVYADVASGACTAPTYAPAGCLSATTAPVGSDEVTVAVPAAKAKKAKRK